MQCRCGLAKVLNQLGCAARAKRTAAPGGKAESSPSTMPRPPRPGRPRPRDCPHPCRTEFAGTNRRRLWRYLGPAGLSWQGELWGRGGRWGREGFLGGGGAPLHKRDASEAKRRAPTRHRRQAGPNLRPRRRRAKGPAKNESAGPGPRGPLRTRGGSPPPPHGRESCSLVQWLPPRACALASWLYATPQPHAHAHAHALQTLFTHCLAPFTTRQPRNLICIRTASSYAYASGRRRRPRGPPPAARVAPLRTAAVGRSHGPSCVFKKTSCAVFDRTRQQSAPAVPAHPPPARKARPRTCERGRAAAALCLTRVGLGGGRARPAAAAAAAHRACYARSLPLPLGASGPGHRGAAALSVRPLRRVGGARQGERLAQTVGRRAGRMRTGPPKPPLHRAMRSRPPMAASPPR
jgi:hypothetical protein